MPVVREALPQPVRTPDYEAPELCSHSSDLLTVISTLYTVWEVGLVWI